MHRPVTLASLTPLSLTTLLLLGGCAAADGTRSTGVDDAGASLPDALGVSLGDGGPIDPSVDAPWPSLGSEADFAGDGSACLDFDDNNRDGTLDCDEPACRRPEVNLACCVGSSLDVCCDARASLVVVDGACGATPCLALGRTALTSTSGRVVAMPPVAPSCATMPALAFAPFGRAGSHSFMVLPRQIDEHSSHLRIVARLGVTTPSSSEVTAAGFGLFTEQGIGAIARPLIAVIASATSNDVRVVVGDRVIATRPLSSDGCGRSLEYAIAVSPEGAFRVESRAPGATLWDVTPIATGSCDVSADARVAMFGQQPNPDGAPVAWVSDLAVEQRGCDLLAPARGTSPILPTETGDDVSGLSVFARPDGAFEALITSGDQIHWLSVQTATGGLVSRVSADPFADNIQPTWPGYRHYRDLDAVTHDGAVRVYLAASVSDDDVFEIVGTTYVPNASPSEPGTLGSALTRIVSASDFPLSASGATPRSVDGPTVADVPRIGLVLAVRVRYSDGHDEIRIAPTSLDGVSADFETAAPSVTGRDASGVTTNGLVHANQARDSDAFDRDEIADPQLVVIDGVARVLFAGRRGTRWAIGSIVASPGFTHFIPVSDAPILGPNGTGFDALGVTQPMLVPRSGTLWLYYAGTDGARRSVGVAVQPILGGP